MQPTQHARPEYNRIADHLYRPHAYVISSSILRKYLSPSHSLSLALPGTSYFTVASCLLVPYLLLMRSQLAEI